MLWRNPWVRWPPASRLMPITRWALNSRAQRLPVGLAEVVDGLGGEPFQRGGLDAVGEDGPVGNEVGVDTRVRLSVGVLGAEQLPRVLRRDRLDRVDVLAAGVEAVPDGALGVLVAQPGTHGHQHGQRSVVLAGDQLQGRPLVGELCARRRGDAGLDGLDHAQGLGVDGRCGAGEIGHGHSWVRGPGNSIESPRQHRAPSALADCRPRADRVGDGSKPGPAGALDRVWNRPQSGPEAWWKITKGSQTETVQ